MLRFLKMTVAEDETIMEETLVVLAEVAQAKEVQHQEEKGTLLQGEKALEVLEAIVILLQEKAVSEEEVLLQEKVVLAEEALHQEQVDFHLTEDLEQKVHQKEHPEDRKVLGMHQEKEDREKANIIC